MMGCSKSPHSIKSISIPPEWRKPPSTQMNKGFFPCTEEKTKLKGKDVPAVQCITATDVAIHAQNISKLEQAVDGLVALIDHENGWVETKKCPWYWPWCKKR